MDAALEESAEVWHTVLSDEFLGLVPAPQPERSPTGAISSARLGEVDAFTVRGTPQTMRRTSLASRRHPSDALKVCVLTHGRAILHQDDREVVLEPGDLAVYDVERPYELRFDDAWACAVMTFPRHAISLSRRDVAHAMERAHDARTGPGAVLEGFLRSAVTEAAAVEGAAAALLGDAGLGLASALLTQLLPAARTSGSAIRDQAVRHVRRHIADPGLSVASIADALRMSPRTLQRHFEGGGPTLSDTIRRERLRGVHRDLTDGRQSNRTIASLAAQWGFTDAPAFTRAFRSAYGISPSQARTLASREFVG